MTYELHLRIYVSRGLAGVFCSIPYHDPPIHTHCSDYIWVLGLISGFIDLAWMIYLLNDIELHLRDRRLLGGSTSIASNLFPIVIVVCRIGRHRLRQLYLSYL